MSTPKPSTDQQKIEKLYQSAMNLRDSTPNFEGAALLEGVYASQYKRAYRITHDVAQFAWETRLYRKIIRLHGDVDRLGETL